MSEKETEGWEKRWLTRSYLASLSSLLPVLPCIYCCLCLSLPFLTHFLSHHRVAFVTKAARWAPPRAPTISRHSSAICHGADAESLMSWPCSALQPPLSLLPASSGHTGILAMVPLPRPIQVQRLPLSPSVICMYHLLSSERFHVLLLALFHTITATPISKLHLGDYIPGNPHPTLTSVSHMFLLLLRASTVSWFYLHHSPYLGGLIQLLLVGSPTSYCLLSA